MPSMNVCLKNCSICNIDNYGSPYSLNIIVFKLFVVCFKTVKCISTYSTEMQYL